MGRITLFFAVLIVSLFLHAEDRFCILAKQNLKSMDDSFVALSDSVDKMMMAFRDAVDMDVAAYQGIKQKLDEANDEKSIPVGSLSAGQGWRSQASKAIKSEVLNARAAYKNLLRSRTKLIDVARNIKPMQITKAPARTPDQSVEDLLFLCTLSENRNESPGYIALYNTSQRVQQEAEIWGHDLMERLGDYSAQYEGLPHLKIATLKATLSNLVQTQQVAVDEFENAWRELRDAAAIDRSRLNQTTSSL